jgi:hypothetical protein
LCPWGRSIRADEPPAPKPKPSWWATYAGIKTVTDDADDARNVVPLLSEGFFRKYPAAHREVWERHGIPWEAIEHRVFTVEPVGRHLNRLLGETAFAWPEKQGGLAGWWAKDVLGPVAEVYGDYLIPRSLDNAKLDAEFRAVLGRPADAPLTDEDRRKGVFDLAEKLNRKYHDAAKKQRTLFADLDAKLLAAWRERKVLKRE